MNFYGMRGSSSIWEFRSFLDKGFTKLDDELVTRRSKEKEEEEEDRE
jgi:hypothetical protein